MTTDPLMDIDDSDQKPKRPRRRKPKPSRPRKPKPSPPADVIRSWWSSIDWHAVGLLLLGVVTIAPYMMRLTNVIAPGVIVPAVSYDVSASKVPQWLELVGSDDTSKASDVAAALRSVAEGCRNGSITNSDALWGRVRDEVVSRSNEATWADWSLFAREVFNEARALKSEGKIATINRDLPLYFEAIAKALEGAK